MRNDNSLYQNEGFHAALAWRRRLVFFLILIERIWPLILPFILSCCLFLSCVWLGVFFLLPQWLHALILVAFACVILVDLLLILRLRWPQKLEIDRHIEHKTGLRFQPLMVQSDDLVATDAMSATLWHAHCQRMRARLQDLKIGLPFAQMPKYDPHGLRSLVFLSFAIAFAYSFSPNAGRLRDAFTFSASPVSMPQIRIDAWIEPPEYTGLAPIYLNIDHARQQAESQEEHRALPSGSVVHFRIIDSPGRVVLWQQSGENPRTSMNSEMASSQESVQLYHLPIIEDTHLQLVSPGREEKWFFTVIKDQPPLIDWIAEPRRAVAGMLELSYQIEDDYGVINAWASINRIGAPTPDTSDTLYDAPQIALILPRSSKGEASTRQDLTNHPWAGMEVEIMLHAQDGAGNITTTQGLIVTLPQRVFGHPLARAVVEQRRLLVQNRANQPLVSDMLAALLIRPENTMRNASHLIALQSAWTRLSYANDTQSLRSFADYLWQIALGIEDDGLNAAQARLKQAQQALRDALRNGATPQEIERLMRQLRQAMQEYIAALAERNAGEAFSERGERQVLQPDDLEQRLQQLEEMAKLGSRGAAEQLLSELESLLDNLQVTQGQAGEGGMNSNERSRMQQQMDNLADMMRRQQDMMNETDRLTQSWQRGDMSGEEYAQQMEGLTRQQEELREEWDALQQQLGQQGLETGEAMAEAGREMGQARDALEREDGYGATGRQGQALEAMRRAGQEMMQAMRNDASEQERQSGALDPLSRERQSGQALQESDTQIPGEIDMERARRILDEIRARFGQMTPLLERQYLERLLNFN